MTWRGNKATAGIILAVALIIAYAAAQSFLVMAQDDVIVKGPGVSEIRMLGEYFSGLKNTAGDTEIYILRGPKPGGRALVLGGTHPNEPSGYMSAILLIENARPQVGELWVIPQSNLTGFTHNDAQEASPQGFTIPTPWGERYFRYGSRATNPINQWPDPDIYIHASSGQRLSGSEVRNLNRAYPGRADGNLTEKIALGITQLIRQENIDLTIDLHEASPEYPVINAIVAHERAMPLAASVAMNLQLDGINIGLEPSPANLRGLTHRELGDHTDTLAILMETANPSQGRLRGRTDEALVLTGKDDGYVKAAQLGRLFVPYDQGGHPLQERVGRHLTSINEFLLVYAEMYPQSPVVVEGIPLLRDIEKNGLGDYLLQPE